MLRLYAGIFTLIFILSSCFFTAKWVDQLSTDYVSQLEYAQSLTQENNWEDAYKITTEVLENWNQQSFPLYILLRHGDIDQISLYFQSVTQYLKQQDEEPYTANNAQLIAQLQLLAEMEQLSLENVF